MKIKISNVIPGKFEGIEIYQAKNKKKWEKKKDITLFSSKCISVSKKFFGLFQARDSILPNLRFVEI